MKFFSTKLPQATISRPKLFFVAFCLALSMWYFVTHHETSEADVELLVNYKGQPKELYVTSGLVYTVHERLRGPKLLLDKLPATIPLPIDISRLKVGDDPTNVFSVVDELKKIVTPSQSRAFKLQSVDPPVIRLHAEYVDSISIPLKVRYRSDNDLIVVTHKVSQNSAVLSGPENEIRKLKDLDSLNIDVRVDLLDMGKGIVSKDISVFVPENSDCPHVKPEPSSVRVFYEVKGERVEVVRSYEINLAVTNPNLYEMQPKEVTVRLKVPEKNKKDVQYLKELRVMALPPDMQEGESKRVQLNFTPPEGMEIMETDKKWVIITRLSGSQIRERHNSQIVPLDKPHEGRKSEKKAESKPRHKQQTTRSKEKAPTRGERRTQKQRD